MSAQLKINFQNEGRCIKLEKDQQAGINNLEVRCRCAAGLF